MAHFLNIFPSKKQQIIKEISKQKIIADYREKSCLVPARLIKEGFEVEFKELKVADYIVKDVAIERKTVADFISSMLNKRLSNQIEELKQYKNKLLIIEGIDEQELYPENNGVSQNSVRGFLLSILLKHKIPVMFTQNYKDTAKFIAVIANKREREISLNAKKKSLNKKEQLQFIIESFPGIGPVNAKKLLKEFRTIKNIINASEKELKKILGKKAEVILTLVEDLY